MLTLQDEEIPLSLRQKSSYQERNFVRNAWENVTEHLTFVESSKHNLFWIVCSLCGVGIFWNTVENRRCIFNIDIMLHQSHWLYFRYEIWLEIQHIDTLRKCFIIKEANIESYYARMLQLYHKVNSFTDVFQRLCLYSKLFLIAFQNFQNNFRWMLLFLYPTLKSSKTYRFSDHFVDIEMG